ncbi:MAG: T9SS type A sorting domain-containing protein [Aureispira sp.]
MTRIVLIFITLYAQLSLGQSLVETRTASLVNGDYSLQGTVHQELYSDSSLVLRFENDYLTQSNVYDVHVFLTNSSNYTTPIDTTGWLLVENIGTISGLNYSSGPRSFNLPTGTGINDYQYIVFVCVQFGRLHWGHGVFAAPVFTNVPYLKDNNKIAVTTYPNPSKNGLVTLQFEEPQEDILLEVLDVNGRVLSNEYPRNLQQHVIQLQEAGIYFIRMTTNKGASVKKVIRL